MIASQFSWIWQRHETKIWPVYINLYIQCSISVKNGYLLRKFHIICTKSCFVLCCLFSTASDTQLHGKSSLFFNAKKQIEMMYIVCSDCVISMHLIQLKITAQYQAVHSNGLFNLNVKILAVMDNSCIERTFLSNE